MSERDVAAPNAVLGTLTGVGLGPGDPELITLRGLRALQASEVVFAPARRGGDPSYALEIAGHLVDRARQRVITLPFPEGGGAAWGDHCGAILDALVGGGRGVFLTEGDPSLFSTWGHLRQALRVVAPGLQVETVPGVSSVTAAAAAAELSLADYGERVAIVPALHCLDRLEETLRLFECVVLIKVARVLPQTIEVLDRLGLLDSAVYVRRCGRPDQEIVRNLGGSRPMPPRDYFSLIIVRRGAP